MKAPGILLLVALLVVGIGYVMYDTVASAQTRCEVCLQFGPETVCRVGVGATEADALRAGQESACGGNTSGMSEIIACLNAEPVSTRCEAS